MKKIKRIVIFLLTIVMVAMPITNTFASPLEGYKQVANLGGCNSNSLEKFDLYFLQLENGKQNKIYSPLSIKYALEMLEEGTTGESKAQISNIIGSYKANKYVNSKNMAFGNAIFINDISSLRESIVISLSSLKTNTLLSLT